MLPLDVRHFVALAQRELAYVSQNVIARSDIDEAIQSFFVAPGCFAEPVIGRHRDLRIIRRIRFAEHVDGVAGLQRPPGESHIGVQREVTDREGSDRVKNPDRKALHCKT
jgi:hypothetical protein